MIEFILYFGGGLVCWNAGRIVGGAIKWYIKKTTPQRGTLHNELITDIFGDSAYIDENGRAQLLEIEYKQFTIEGKDAQAVAVEIEDGSWLVSYNKKKRQAAQDIDFEVV